MNTSKIKSDHDALFGSIDALRALVQAGIAENAAAIFKELVKTSAAIKLHLAVEDRMLYPALAGAADPSIAATGKRFQQEMGGLANAYGAFAARWNSISRISGEPAEFRREANDVFKALHARILLENNELLPLAETV